MTAAPDDGSHTALAERASQALTAGGVGAAAPRLAWFVPGRVEVLGKHTDYAGGRSLLAAVGRGIVMVAVPRSDNQIRLTDALTGETATSAFSPEVTPPPGHWTNYPLTVARRLARNFPAAHTGADLAIAGNLPLAAGLSSSSALVTAMALALIEVNELAATDAYRRSITSVEDLAGYLGCVENGQSFGALDGDRGVGTFGGSEDHLAILGCEPGRLSQCAFGPIRRERVVPFPDGHVFVIGVSGVVADKTGTAREAYNRASLATAAILTRWNSATDGHDSTLMGAVTSTPDSLDRMRAMLAGDDVLLARLEQLVEESLHLIPAASEALACGDLDSWGALVDRSQRGAERGLANQVPETVELARSARELGAIGASSFGAGFGGSVWAMVRESDAESFIEAWMNAYAVRFPDRAGAATAFVTRPGPAARRIR